MINEIINGLNNLWNWLSQIGANISDSVVQAYSWLYSSLSVFGEKIKEAFNSFGQFIYNGLNWIAQNFYNAYEWLSNRINEGLKWICDGITWIGTQIYNFGNWIWNSVIGFIKWIWEGIQSIINYIWSIICKTWNELIDFINEWIMYINKLLNNWFLSLRRKFTNFIVVNLTLPTMFKSFQKFILYPNWKNLLSTFSIPILAPILGRLVDSVIPKPQSEFVIFFPPLKLPKLDKEELYIPKPNELPSPPIDVIPPRPPTDQIQKICRNYIKSKINVDLVNSNILFSNNKIISRINLNLLEKSKLKFNNKIIENIFINKIETNKVVGYGQIIHLVRKYKLLPSYINLQNKVKSSIDKKIEVYIEYPYLNKLKILNYFDMFLGDIKKIKHKIKTSYILINKEMFKLKEINKIKSKLLIDIIEEVKNLIIKNNIRLKIDIEKILLPVNLISKSNYIKLNCEYNLSYNKFITNKNIIRDNIQLKVIKNYIPIKTTNLIRIKFDINVFEHSEYDSPYIYVILNNNGRKLYMLNIFDFSLHSKLLDLPNNAKNVSKFGNYITITYNSGSNDYTQFRNKETLEVCFSRGYFEWKIPTTYPPDGWKHIQIGGWKNRVYIGTVMIVYPYRYPRVGVARTDGRVHGHCFKLMGWEDLRGACDGDNEFIYYYTYGRFRKAKVRSVAGCGIYYGCFIDTAPCVYKSGSIPNGNVKGIAVGQDIILVYADKIYVYDKDLNLIKSYNPSYNFIGFGGKFYGYPSI